MSMTIFTWLTMHLPGTYNVLCDENNIKDIGHNVYNSARLFMLSKLISDLHACAHVWGFLVTQYQCTSRDEVSKLYTDCTIYCANCNCYSVIISVINPLRPEKFELQIMLLIYNYSWDHGKPSLGFFCSFITCIVNDYDLFEVVSKMN